MSESKITEYADKFPNISADEVLETLRELRSGTASEAEQAANRTQIEPCLRLTRQMVEYLNGGSVDNAIDKFVLKVCARVGVQFLGNATVANPTNQNILWSHKDKLRDILSYDDTKLKNYTAMVYHSLTLHNAEIRREIANDQELLFILLDEALLGLTEFPQFTIEKLLTFDHFDELYNSPRGRLLHRLYILDLVISLINADKGFVLASRHVEKITEDFRRQAELILNGPKSETDNKQDLKDLEGSNSAVTVDANQDPRLAVKLLATLCVLSASDAYRQALSDNASLVIDVIYVLRAIKMAGDKENESSVGIDLNHSAVIGFKSDLIRLLGNLVWKSKKNQDLVRENKCIELILECCKLDEKNPFICEWSIVAIRNLCENNPENQGFIASVTPVNNLQLPSTQSASEAQSS